MVSIRHIADMTRIEYNQCVERFSDAIFRFILKACQNKSLAEDVVQDSFLVLWEHVDKISQNKAKAFLFTTSYRKMIDVLRHEKKNTDMEHIDSNHFLSEEYTTDLQQILEFALDKLPTIQRTVVLLRDYEDYSYREIAEITALTETQVKVYIFRARAFMKAFIRRPNLVV